MTEHDSKTKILLSKDFISKKHRGALDGTAFQSSRCITNPDQVRVFQRYTYHLNPDLDRYSNALHWRNLVVVIVPLLGS